jgi:DNA replicative helicase MCM subunit Mcm2 (Cdc46/Mcm family)
MRLIPSHGRRETSCRKLRVVVVIVGAPRQSLIDSHQPPLSLSPSLLHATALFALFLREHTILTTVTNDDDVDSSDNEETFLEPTAEGKQLLRRTSCFPPHLQRIKNRHPYTPHQNTFIIEVPLSELAAWDAVRGMELAQRAIKNGMRYQELFCRVVDSILGGMEVTTDGTAGGLSGGAGARDSIDVLLEQRRAQQDARVAEQAENANNRMGGEDSNGPLGGGGLENDAANMGATAGNNGSATEDLPPLLMRRYELRILPLRRPGIFPPFNRQYRADGYGAKTLDGGVAAAPSSAEGAVEGVSLRQIRSRSMGHLVTLRGMIVRSSDVKPACTVATYTCDACGCEIYQVVQNKREFMPQRICPVEDCRKVSKGGDTLHLQTRGSKFVKFQELKLQELPSQVPMGHVPRSMSIHCRGELTRQVSPGDVVTIDGVFLPQRVAESGYRAMKAGLVATTFLEAQNIVVHKKSYDDSASSYLSEEEKAKLDEEIRVIATGDDPVGMLSTAIAPEIFGHEDIKRALLLMLVGGCTRKLPDGMRIRGDINICLMGDPGVAKSQLLKHVASIAPRGVYTTGKGSSGVGLTAAITKDVTTGELALEGGALVLADRGICAIDEFDK